MSGSIKIIGIDANECYSMRGAILFLCSLCSACVMHEEYPSHWSPVVVSTKECPDITGTYEDVGEVSSSDSELSDFDTGFRLSEIFLEAPLEHNAKLTISHPDANSIQASIQGSGASNKSHRHSREGGDYSCKDGKIWFSESSPWVIAEMYAIGYERGQVGFAKSEDGSLIGEVRSSGAGVAFLIVPIGGSKRDYIIWKVADVEPKH